MASEEPEASSWETIEIQYDNGDKRNVTLDSKIVKMIEKGDGELSDCILNMIRDSNYTQLSMENTQEHPYSAIQPVEGTEYIPSTVQDHGTEQVQDMDHIPSKVQVQHTQQVHYTDLAHRTEFGQDTEQVNNRLQVQLQETEHIPSTVQDLVQGTEHINDTTQLQHAEQVPYTEMIQSTEQVPYTEMVQSTELGQDTVHIPSSTHVQSREHVQATAPFQGTEHIKPTVQVQDSNTLFHTETTASTQIVPCVMKDTSVKTIKKIPINKICINQLKKTTYTPKKQDIDKFEMQKLLLTKYKELNERTVGRKNIWKKICLVMGEAGHGNLVAEKWRLKVRNMKDQYLNIRAKRGKHSLTISENPIEVLLSEVFGDLPDVFNNPANKKSLAATESEIDDLCTQLDLENAMPHISEKRTSTDSEIWSYENKKLLLLTYKDMLKHNIKNRWARVAEVLNNAGISVSSEKCRLKLKSMRDKYCTRQKNRVQMSAPKMGNLLVTNGDQNMEECNNTPIQEKTNVNRPMRWSFADEKLLLTTYKEVLSKPYLKSGIWKRLRHAFNKFGYRLDPEQCRMKIKQLRAKYMKFKEEKFMSGSDTSVDASEMEILMTDVFDAQPELGLNHLLDLENTVMAERESHQLSSGDARNCNDWSYVDEKLLLSTYKAIRQEKGVVKKWETITNTMNTYYGYNLTPKKCILKVKAMRKRYRLLKRKRGNLPPANIKEMLLRDTFDVFEKDNPHANKGGKLSPVTEIPLVEDTQETREWKVLLLTTLKDVKTTIPPITKTWKTVSDRMKLEGYSNFGHETCRQRLIAMKEKRALMFEKGLLKQDDPVEQLMTELFGGLHDPNDESYEDVGNYSMECDVGNTGHEVQPQGLARWSFADQNLLLTTYKDYEDKKWEQISETLNSYGYSLDAEKCEAKIKDLKVKYREFKQSPTGKGQTQVEPLLAEVFDKQLEEEFNHYCQPGVDQNPNVSMENYDHMYGQAGVSPMLLDGDIGQQVPDNGSRLTGCPVTRSVMGCSSTITVPKTTTPKAKKFIILPVLQRSQAKDTSPKTLATSDPSPTKHTPIKSITTRSSGVTAHVTKPTEDNGNSQPEKSTVVQVAKDTYRKILPKTQNVPSVKITGVYKNATKQSSEPAILAIDIMHGNDGFGFQLADSVFGQTVAQISDRARCKNLQERDLLLKINGTSVDGLAHSKVIQILRDCPIGEETRFILRRSGTGHLLTLHQSHAAPHHNSQYSVMGIQSHAAPSHSSQYSVMAMTPAVNTFTPLTNIKNSRPARPRVICKKIKLANNSSQPTKLTNSSEKTLVHKSDGDSMSKTTYILRSKTGKPEFTKNSVGKLSSIAVLPSTATKTSPSTTNPHFTPPVSLSDFDISADFSTKGTQANFEG